MKKIFVISIIFLSCASEKKKGDDGAIQRLIDQYNTAYVNKDWERLADVFHPSQFYFINRELYIKGFQRASTREHFKVLGNKLMIDSISAEVIDGTYKYRLLYLRNEIVSGFPTNKGLEDLCQTFRRSPDDVSCGINGNQLTSVRREKYYAVFLDPEGKWFLLSRKEQTDEITDKIIPQSVRKSLGY